MSATGEARHIPTLADWQDEPFVEPKDILDKLLTEEGLTLLYGEAGAGKSTALRRFVMQAVLGKAFAGRHFLRPCRVLFIALEQSKNRLRMSLDTLAESMGLSRDDARRLYLISEGSEEHQELVDEAMRLGASDLAGRYILEWIRRKIMEL